MLIGSHVSYTKEKGLLGSVIEALSYKSNCFMFYTGTPQNTIRYKIDHDLVDKADLLMKENGIDKNNVIVHAPYIVNLANNLDISKYQFSIDFLINEVKRCEELKTKYLVLHPGNSLTLDKNDAIKNISNALNNILSKTSVTILLETMSGKGSEIGSSFEEIKKIIDLVEYKNIGVCLDTCHLNDAGYDLNDFDYVLDQFDKIIGINYIKCIHINDSKNDQNFHKDRHENIGYGTIGFDNLIKIIYHDLLKDVPKILETPYVNDKAPYEEEISMIRKKEFNNFK